MERKGWWSAEEDTETKKQARVEVLQAFNRAESLRKPPISDLFTDVYHDIPPHLQQQQAEMQRMISKYPDQYPLATHAEK
jgi:2-oxoisovalerate dehydrogenase E1 component alpha subunit